jgi:hypothetical protein
MLRAQKLVAYIAEKIESDLIPLYRKNEPEEWLDILCQDKVFRV